jgi:hypothetical protein
MAVVFDAFSSIAEATGTLTWTHTTSASPKAAIVLVVQNSGADGVTTVTYGGTSMTEVTGSPNLKTSGEPGGVHVFFLGASVPTGNQTVTVNVSGAVARVAGAITLTANADTEVVDTDATINSDAVANPSATLSLGGKTCFACIAFHSGRQAVGNITPTTNWTSRFENDFGAQLAGIYTYDTIGTTDVAAGWTQTSDDATAISLAVSEGSTTADVTHTTGALIKAASDVVHTGDSLVKAAIDQIHTGDSLIKETFDVSHTSGSLIKAASDVVHSCDSIIKAAQDSVHTGDALIQVVDNDVSGTTDAYVVETFDKAHTSDSLIKAAQDSVHTTDASIFEPVTTRDILITGYGFINEENNEREIVVTSYGFFGQNITEPDVSSITHTTDALISDGERQWIIPGDRQINETDGQREYIVPGYGQFNETIPTARCAGKRIDRYQ